MREHSMVMAVDGPRAVCGMSGTTHRRWKARVRVARLHRRIRHIRSAFLHKCSTTIVRDNQTLVIENLCVQNMLGNHRLARAISDAGWCEFRRQLVYTSVRYQRTLLGA